MCVSKFLQSKNQFIYCIKNILTFMFMDKLQIKFYYSSKKKLIKMNFVDKCKSNRITTLNSQQEEIMSSECI